MQRIFIGFIFIFLDFSFNVGNFTIGLIPDFVGFILIAMGLLEFMAKNKLFKKAYYWSIGLAIYTGILYLVNISGVAYKLSYALSVLEIIGTICSLYASYLIVMGITEIERTESVDLQVGNLKTSWTLSTLFQLLSYISVVFAAASIVMIVISSFFSIIFLINMNTTKKRYISFFSVQPQNNGYIL